MYNGSAYFQLIQYLYYGGVDVNNYRNLNFKEYAELLNILGKTYKNQEIDLRNIKLIEVFYKKSIADPSGITLVPKGTIAFMSYNGIATFFHEVFYN